MKFYWNNLAKLNDLIAKGKIKSLLLFGPNRGLIDIIISKILSNNSFRTVRCEGKSLQIDDLMLKLNSLDLFGDKNLVKIDNVTTINKGIIDYLQKGEFDNFPCFVAGESVKAAFKKTFEAESNMASIGCYYLEQPQIASLIAQQCRSKNFQISEEAVFYLADHLPKDNLIIKSELEKLFLCMHDQANIELSDVKKIISLDLTASSDLLCIAFAKKNHLQFVNELSKLQEQGANHILIIRALIRYFLNIFYASCHIENGCSIEEATKALPSKIFYKYISDFHQIVQLYTSSETLKILQALQECEVQFKKKPNEAYLINIMTL